MTPQEITDVALDWPKVTEEEPYGPGALVYKVAGKTFAILQPETEPPQVTLKCEPALALELRAQFPAVGEGYHVNKKHWNTVLLDGTVPTEEVQDMLDHSYQRVVDAMPKATRESINLRR